MDATTPPDTTPLPTIDQKLDLAVQRLDERVDKEITDRVAYTNTIAARNLDRALTINTRVEALETRITRYRTEALMFAGLFALGIMALFFLVGLHGG